MASRSTARRSRAAALLTAAAAAAAAVLTAVRRRRGAPGRRAGAAGAAADETWTCACGAGFRVRGAGRHQVFWAEGAPEHEPLLEQVCPSCGRGLGAAA
jgi:hypothetical protein